MKRFPPPVLGRFYPHSVQPFLHDSGPEEVVVGTDGDDVDVVVQREALRGEAEVLHGQNVRVDRLQPVQPAAPDDPEIVAEERPHGDFRRVVRQQFIVGLEDSSGGCDPEFAVAAGECCLDVGRERVARDRVEDRAFVAVVDGIPDEEAVVLPEQDISLVGRGNVVSAQVVHLLERTSGATAIDALGRGEPEPLFVRGDGENPLVAVGCGVDERLQPEDPLRVGVPVRLEENDPLRAAADHQIAVAEGQRAVLVAQVGNLFRESEVAEFPFPEVFADVVVREEDPESLVPVVGDVQDPVVDDGGAVAGEVAEGPERPSVEAVQSVEGPDPEHHVAVLRDRGYGVLREPVVDRVQGDPLLAAGLRARKQQKEQKGSERCCGSIPEWGWVHSGRGSRKSFFSCARIGL